MIIKGGKKVIGVSKGSAPIARIYKGTRIIWSKKVPDYTSSNVPNGVYIYATDGGFYDVDNWDSKNNSEAVGVALITDKCRFVIAPDRIAIGIKWGTRGSILPGVFTSGWSFEAETDFDGQGNTTAIVNYYGATASLFDGLPIAEIVNGYAAQSQQGQLQAGSQKGSLKGGSVASSDVVINKPISDAQAQEWKSDIQNLTQEQKQQLTEYNDAKLKEDFCSKFGITTEDQFIWVIGEIRSKLVKALPEQTTEYKLTESDIDNITDLGIMSFALEMVKPDIMPMDITQNTNPNMYAALWCVQYTFKNGEKGYLGSCGEIKEMYSYIANINEAISKIGGTPILINGTTFWTSTQVDNDYAWGRVFNRDSQNSPKKESTTNGTFVLGAI